MRITSGTPETDFPKTQFRPLLKRRIASCGSEPPAAWFASTVRSSSSSIAMGGGLVSYRNGLFRLWSKADGLTNGYVRALRQDTNGRHLDRDRRWLVSASQSKDRTVGHTPLQRRECAPAIAIALSNAYEHNHFADSAQITDARAASRLSHESKCNNSPSAVRLSHPAFSKSGLLLNLRV
jgi:hypothetical protein